MLQDILILISTLVILFLIDFIVVRKWPELTLKRPSFRWIFLHAVANFAVVLVHIDDVIKVYRYPLDCMYHDADTSGSVIVFSLHLYHVMFFYKSFERDDWVHHILMCFVVLPIGWFLQPGSLLGHGAFWASGLPGGINYVMLVLVRLGMMAEEKQRRINGYLHLYLRAPFCLFHSLFVYLTFIRWHDSFLTINRHEMWLMYCFATIVTFLAFYWNAMYFCEEVVISNTMKKQNNKSQ
jgi:hypothetical protein